MAEDWGIDVGIPDIGDKVEYKDRTFNVTGWLRERKKVKPRWDYEVGDVRDPDFFDEVIFEAQRPIHGKKLEWCYRDEAEFLSATPYGCIPVIEARIVGRAPWAESILQEFRNSAKRFADTHQIVF